MTRPANPRYGEVPARRFDSGGSGRLRDPRLAWVRTGGRAALMRINIWIVLGVLLVLLAVTRLLRYQQDTQRICADDPIGFGVRAVSFALHASALRSALPDLCFGITSG